jgi:predicted ATP-grasp superfamily ATP-dependent carboligase
VLKCEADIEKLSRLRYPLIVKPADKSFVHSGRTRRLACIGTKDEGFAVCSEMLSTAGELVVQEWIEGPDSDIYFSLFHSGKDPGAASIFHGRKIASYPPRVGSTAVCMAAPEMTDVLGPLAQEFIAAAAYEGLGSLEYKWNAQANRFLIIEPTVGRTDWQEEIATLSGLNLPLIAYRYELGLPPVSETTIDRGAAWRESFRHRIPLDKTPPAIRVYDGYWRNDDPIPALVYYAHFIFRNTLGRVTLPTLWGKAPTLHKQKGIA